MSEKDLRRRVTANRRTVINSRALRPSPSPSPAARRRIRPGGGKLWKPSENVKVLKRSKSEPSLWKACGDAAVAVAASWGEKEEEGVLYRPGTCTDIFSSTDNLVPRSPGICSEIEYPDTSFEVTEVVEFLNKQLVGREDCVASCTRIKAKRYNKDDKVVINVTVEGSPGPIQTMVKLGSNIEEITKLVVKKYNEEGRTPHLDNDSASTCELHHSYFSLQSLSKSDLIADVGSRSFYLRKCSSSHRSDDSRTDKTSASSNQLEISSLPFLTTFINRKIKKIIRRTRKVWKILGCIPCTG